MRTKRRLASSTSYHPFFLRLRIATEQTTRMSRTLTFNSECSGIPIGQRSMLKTTRHFKTAREPMMGSGDSMGTQLKGHEMITCGMICGRLYQYTVQSQKVTISFPPLLMATTLLRLDWEYYTRSVPLWSISTRKAYTEPVVTTTHPM